MATTSPLSSSSQPALLGPETSCAPLSPQSLVLTYLPLVRMIAWQIYGSLPAHAAVEMGDVVQAGNLGLLNASQTFHPAAGVPFASFARHRIRGEILDSLRKLDPASRGLRRWQRSFEAESRNLALALSREPSEQEMSDRLGMRIDSLRKRKLTLWYTASCVAPDTNGAESGDGARHVPAPAEGNPDRVHQRRQTRQVLINAIGILPPRSRKVVLSYYIHNLTMKQIGELLHVNESRVSQIHKQALAAIARRLRASGVKDFQDL